MMSSQSRAKSTDSGRIARRYVVVNGFDGALTTLGLLAGFALGPEVPSQIVTQACLSAAIALGVSGVTSAYLSESAERRREIAELEQAMMTDLSDSGVARAGRAAAWLVAFANGVAPFVIAILIVLPIWLLPDSPAIPSPIGIAIAWAFCCVFVLGAYLGHVGHSGWLLSGAKAVLVAAATMIVISVVQL